MAAAVLAVAPVRVIREDARSRFSAKRRDRHSGQKCLPRELTSSGVERQDYMFKSLKSITLPSLRLPSELQTLVAVP